MHRFPSAVEHGKLASRLLENAYHARDGDELECALTVGFVFGFAPEHAKILSHLVEADWHIRDEDVVGALQTLRAPEAVVGLERCTYSVHEHLAYDGFFGLARKCTWALADIGTPDAREALTRISNCANPIIAGYAKKRLDNWEKELNRKRA